MSLTLLARGTGTRRAEDRIAELEARLTQVEADNVALTAANEDLVCDLTRAVVRSCQDGIRIAELETENKAMLTGIKQLQGKVIRAGAEHQRLRQAVINARPRIREVDTQLVRPYSPVVVLPYVSPVPHRDTSNDDTQELPILDRP